VVVVVVVEETLAAGTHGGTGGVGSIGK
jgi:hypothetical protein